MTEIEMQNRLQRKMTDAEQKFGLLVRELAVTVDGDYRVNGHAPMLMADVTEAFAEWREAYEAYYDYKDVN